MKNKNINLYDALIKSGAEVDEKQKGFLDALSTAIGKALEETDSTFSQALKDALGEAEKDKDGNVIPMAKQLADIAAALEKMEKTNTSLIGEKEKFQLRKYVRDNHDSIVDAIKNKKELDGFEFTAIKAAAPFTTTSAVSNGSGVGLPLVENYLVENDIALIRHPENFILDVIPNTLLAKVPREVIKTEQTSEEGAVAVVAEGGTKPLVSDTFIRNRTLRKKYAGRLEWTEEFEMDNEMLFNEILRMFEDKVNRAWQDGIIATLITNAVAYTSSVFDGTFVKPDNALAVIAGQSVIQGMYFTPNVVIMNPSDIFTAMFTQDTEGRAELKPYIVNNNGSYSINGMRVFSSYKIAQGTALIGDSSVYREWHSNYIFRVGTYDDQFITNEKTAIGEVFSLLRIANNEKPAWMVLDLDAVKEDITIVTP